MKTREKILLATLNLAVSQGLGNVTVQQIADAVGIRKASIFSHFASREEIIKELYSYLRQNSVQAVSPEPVDYPALFTGKTAQQILLACVQNYRRINELPQMKTFYTFVCSERYVNDDAARIIQAETNRMLQATTELFTAMQAHKLLAFPDLPTAATIFALTVHELLDMFATPSFGITDIQRDKQLEDFTAEFCRLYQLP